MSLASLRGTLAYGVVVARPTIFDRCEKKGATSITPKTSSYPSIENPKNRKSSQAFQLHLQSPSLAVAKLAQPTVSDRRQTTGHRTPILITISGRLSSSIFCTRTFTNNKPSIFHTVCNCDFVNLKFEDYLWLPCLGLLLVVIEICCIGQSLTANVLVVFVFFFFSS